MRGGGATLGGKPVRRMLESEEMTDMQSDRNAEGLVRFSISIEPGLLGRFDDLLRRRGYATRSEAIRDSIRRQLAQHRLDSDGRVVGVITALYDETLRRKKDPVVRLSALLHDTQAREICSTHVHLSKDHIIETIVVSGEARSVLALSDKIGAMPHVLYCDVSATVPPVDEGGHKP